MPPRKREGVGGRLNLFWWISDLLYILMQAQDVSGMDEVGIAQVVEGDQGLPGDVEFRRDPQQGIPGLDGHLADRSG